MLRSSPCSEVQEFNTDRLACGIDQLAVANFEPGLFQQPGGFAQDCCEPPPAIAADRILVRRREELGRHLVAYRFENLQFLPLGKARRGEFGDAVEIAAVAMVLPPFESSRSDVSQS